MLVRGVGKTPVMLLLQSFAKTLVETNGKTSVVQWCSTMFNDVQSVESSRVSRFWFLRCSRQIADEECDLAMVNGELKVGEATAVAEEPQASWDTSNDSNDVFVCLSSIFLVPFCTWFFFDSWFASAEQSLSFDKFWTKLNPCDHVLQFLHAFLNVFNLSSSKQSVAGGLGSFPAILHRLQAPPSKGRASSRVSGPKLIQVLLGFCKIETQRYYFCQSWAARESNQDICIEFCQNLHWSWSRFVVSLKFLLCS